MTEQQLACLLCASGALGIAAIKGFVDLACRAIGEWDNPADPVNAFQALGRAAQAGIATGVAAIGTLVGGLFGWAVRP